MNGHTLAPVLLSIDEVSTRVGIPKATLYTWRTRYPNRGPRAVKIGGLLRYRVADVDSWVRSLRD